VSTDHIEAADVEQRLNAFRNSIAPDAYSVATFVPWQDIDRQIEELATPVETLQGLVYRPQRSARRHIAAQSNVVSRQGPRM
jgi:hypothetical protein